MEMRIPSLITSNLKVNIVISTILRLLIAGILFTSVVEKKFLLVFISAVMLFISFLPSLITRRYKIFLPPELEIVYSLFLFAYFILGEMNSYFTLYWWWDIILHSFAAFMLGLIGFLIMYVFHVTQKIKMSALLTALFSFCFAMSIGAVWEIFEFCMDYFFGFNMQKSGLLDTMTDIIVDSLGALLVSGLGFLYIKRGKRIFLKRIADKFIEMNKKILWLK